MAETLRLQAEVVDKFSQPLRNLRDRLREIRSPEGLERGRKEFEKYTETVRKAAEAMKTGYEQATRSLGLESVFAAGAVAGLASAIKKTADTARDLKALSAETGLSTRSLQVWGAAADQLGVKNDAFAGSLRELNKHVFDLRRGIDQGLVGNLLQLDPTGGLLSVLKDGTPVQRLERLVDILKRTRDPELRGRISELLTGGRDFAKIAADPEALKRALENAQKLPAYSEDDIKRAERLQQILDSMAIRSQTLQTTIGLTFGPHVITAMEKMEEILRRSGDAAKEEGWGRTMTRGLATAVLGDRAMIGIARHDLGVMDRQREREKAAGTWSADKEERYQRDSGSYRRDIENSERHLGIIGPYGGLSRQSGEIPGGLEALKKKLQEGSKDGTREGMEEAIRKMSFEAGSGFGGGGAQLLQAAYRTGGGGGAYGAARERLRDFVRGKRGGSDGTSVDTGGSSAGSLTRLTEDAAREAGIDPRILHGIRAGESGHSSRYDVGDLNNGPAYGPWQLNVGRGRLGDRFQRETGLDLRNPSTIAAQTRWVAGYIAKRLRDNPNYSPGGEWFGFHGMRDASSRWGDSGYRPMPERFADHPGVAGRVSAGGGYPDAWLDRSGGGVLRHGQALMGAQGPDGLRGSATLGVHISKDGTANVRADGGDLFKRIEVSHGRTMMPSPASN